MKVKFDRPLFVCCYMKASVLIARPRKHFDRPRTMSSDQASSSTPQASSSTPQASSSTCAVCKEKSIRFSALCGEHSRQDAALRREMKLSGIAEKRMSPEEHAKLLKAFEAYKQKSLNCKTKIRWRIL
jgi:hypothetical protein